MPGENYSPQTLIFGAGGLDLVRAITLVQPNRLTRMTNTRRILDGGITSRLGLALAASTGEDAAVHSLGSLNSPDSPGDYTRIAGVGSDLFVSLPGAPGTITEVDTGYSGSPLTMVPYRPPLSSESWMYIGDASRMRKVRASDGLDLPIGFPPKVLEYAEDRFRIDEFARVADGGLNSRDRTRFTSFGFDVIQGPLAGGFVQLADEQRTDIDDFEAAGWTNNQGTGDGAPSNALDGTNKKEGSNSVQFTSSVSSNGGYNFWNKANALDLSVLADGAAPATDDDILHFWIRVGRPDLVQEIRIYFVVSASFDTATIPGTSATANTDAYVKAFRPSDFTQIFEASASTLPVAGAYNITTQTLERLDAVSDTRAAVELIKQQTEAIRAASLPLLPGRAQWSELGSVGLPLYRGSFRRIGNDATRGWGNVTGIVVFAQLLDDTDIWLDDMYLTGGSGPNSAEIGSLAYDYRVIDYDPRTGAKGNPSPVQKLSFRLDSLRRGFVINPTANGDSAVRQRAYRRGGVLVNNWYFAGENEEDGGTITDRFSDAEVLTAGTLEIDNDQPVTTTDEEGDTVRAQALPAIWGPINDLLFGCGDPHRRGHIYWPKVGEPDHWPVANNLELCAPDEELMNGAVWGGQSFVLSRERGYSVYINLAGAGTVNAVPNGCTRGLAGRLGIAPGPDGIYFVATDGIFRTQGGPETSITDEDLWGIFHGQTVNGYAPVDFTEADALRLAWHEGELWFLYKDTSGADQVLVYSLTYNQWRHYEFGKEVHTLNPERPAGMSPVLALGGLDASQGRIYTHAGTDDAGEAFTALVRTPALDQGFPRNEKQYGDLWFDLDRGGATITVTPRANEDGTDLQAQTISTGSGRQRYYLDTLDAAGNPGPYTARNLSLELSWEPSGTTVLYLAGLSYIPQPDDHVARVTDLSAEGRLTDKYLKGVVLECDTGGAAKQVRVEVDGAVVATLDVTASGRGVHQFAFAQARGRIFRLRPIGSGEWKLYDYRWVFDEEPLKLTRWESQLRDEGMERGGIPLYGYLTLESRGPTAFSVTVYREDGSSAQVTETIPHTGGAKKKIYVPFEPTRGALFKYLATNDSGVYVYREETTITYQPWGGGQLHTVRPFGNDDLDLNRAMVDASLAASRQGGGGGAR